MEWTEVTPQKYVYVFHRLQHWSSIFSLKLKVLLLSIADWKPVIKYAGFDISAGPVARG